MESLRSVFSNPDTSDIRSALTGLGYTIHRDNNRYYAVSFSGKRIVSLNDEGLDLTRLMHLVKSKTQATDQNTHPDKRNATTGRLKLRDAGGGSHGEKREWEVGNNSNYDRIDDGKSLKL